MAVDTILAMLADKQVEATHLKSLVQYVWLPLGHSFWYLLFSVLILIGTATYYRCGVHVGYSNKFLVAHKQTQASMGIKWKREQQL